MELRALKVLHWRGGHTAASAPDAQPGLFVIDTCQRRVAIALDPAAIERAHARLPADGALECFSSVDAYAFLLRFACGLESKLVAETEIFGQIKAAWREFSAGGSALAAELAPCMQWLFEDAKTVRAAQLANLGSASYGSLVRRLLGERTGERTVLLVGAGQLAQSVGPWIEADTLLVSNRTAERSRELARELAKREGTRAVEVLEPSEELQGWARAQDVIICVPPDAAQDPARIAAWRVAHAASGGRLIHLGLGADLGAWDGVPGLVPLAQVLGMLRVQSDKRRTALERARRACMERALLRSLGASASHTHSWEDLAVFDQF